MSKARKTSLKDVEWESHELTQYRNALDRDQAMESGAVIGERMAMAVNCKTKPELVEALETGKDEFAMPLLDLLEEAEVSLKNRLRLVECALARICSCAKLLEAKLEA